MTTKTRGVLEEDDRIEITSDFAVDNTERLWGRPSGWRPFLRRGRYVVSIKISDSDLLLAEADWDRSGKVTFSSAQHTYAVRGRGVSALLAKFRA